MTLRIDDDLWPAIRQHTWKWQTGRVDTIGAIIHATRSGIPGRTAALEYTSACNWFLSPNNVVRDQAGNPWFGGMSTYIIGGGRRALCVPPEYVPRFSAGIHDFRAISIELGQGTNDDPYDERDIEMVMETLDYHGLPTNRIPFVDGNNIGWPGMVGHEDTAQGRGQGKSDPGPLFWTAWSDLLTTEDDMATNAEQAAQLEAYAKRLALIALLTDKGENGYAATLEFYDSAKAKGWVS